MAQRQLILETLVKGTSSAVRGLKQISGSLEGVGRQAKSLGKSLSISVTAPLTALGALSVRTTARMQGIENAIKFASGSSVEASKNLNFLRETVDRLGLETESTQRGFKTLIGSMQGSSLTGGQVREIFTGVANAATAMGLTAEQSEGAFLALGQMMSKGKVQAEELRGQLGERIPGAFQLAAKAMGVTTGELNKMLERGEVVADEFLPRFAVVLNETFGTAAQQASNNLQQNINRLSNSFTDLKLIVGEAIVPVFIQIVDKVKGAIETFKNLDKNTQKIIITVGALAAAAGPLLVIFGQIAIAITALAGPLGLVIAGVGLLAGGFVALKVAQSEAAAETERLNRLFRDTGTEIDDLLRKEEQHKNETKAFMEEKMGFWERTRRTFIEGEVAKFDEKSRLLKEDHKRVLETNKNNVAIVEAASKAELRIGAAKVKQRLKMAHKAGVTEADLISKLLEIREGASKEEIQTFINALNAQQKAAGKFKGNLVAKFSVPIVQEIVVAVRKQDGILAGLTRGLQSVKQGAINTAQQLAAATKNVNSLFEEINNPLSEFEQQLQKIGAGAGGNLGGAGKSAEDMGKKYEDAVGKATKALDDLDKAHQEKLGSIQSEMDSTLAKITEVEMAYQKATQSEVEKFASSIVKTEETIRKLGEDIADAEEKKTKESLELTTRLREAKTREQKDRLNRQFQEFKKNQDEIINTLKEKLLQQETAHQQAMELIATIERNKAENIKKLEEERLKFARDSLAAQTFEERAAAELAMEEVDRKIAFAKAVETDGNRIRTDLIKALSTEGQKAHNIDLENAAIAFTTKIGNAKIERDTTIAAENAKLDKLRETKKLEIKEYDDSKDKILGIIERIKNGQISAIDAATGRVKTQVGAQIAVFNELESAANQAKKAIDEISLSGAGRIVSGLANALGRSISGFRANGGPVQANRAYVVGERRPEVFVPDRSGTILPSTAGLGGGTVINIAINTMVGSREFASQMADQIVRDLKFSTAF